MPKMKYNNRCVLFSFILVQILMILFLMSKHYSPYLSMDLLHQTNKINGPFITGNASPVRIEEKKSTELWFNESAKNVSLYTDRKHGMIGLNSQKHVNDSIELQPMFHHRSDTIEDKVKKNQNKIEKITNSQGLENRIFLCPAKRARLGNWMFMFASSVGIAHTLNYKFLIDLSHPLFENFKIKQKAVRGTVDNVVQITEPQWRNMDWRNNKTYVSYNLTLYGFFQSWKYFENDSAEIRASFEIKPRFREKAMTFLKTYTPENKTLIGVHVRRGDFIERSYIGRVVADKSYIEKAMDFYRDRYGNAFFIVVSDDKQWCKDNIEGNDVAFSEFLLPILDMAIMSLSDHAIITAGSFSWWGGWLCGGTVVYLKDFPRPDSTLETQMFGGENPKTREDYYHPEWIGMSNS